MSGRDELAPYCLTISAKTSSSHDAPLCRLSGGKSRAKGAEERGFKNLQNSGTQELPKPELQTPNLKLPSRTSAYLCATKSGANTGHRPPTTTDFKTFALRCYSCESCFFATKSVGEDQAAM